jgi:hypothetical protein
MSPVFGAVSPLNEPSLHELLVDPWRGKMVRDRGFEPLTPTVSR